MRLGYNTNGLAHHRLGEALTLLAEEGYESVALTLDAGVLDPYGPDLDRQLRETRDRLDRLGLARVVETGARFLLNYRKKHDPTLLDPDPARRAIRIDFLSRAIDIAADLGAEAVSLWSGSIPDIVSDDEALDRLARSLMPVIERAEERSMTLAFEPEPGMFVDTFARFEALDVRVHHPLFQLTVDVGHVHCIEEGPVAEYIRTWGPRIRNIHIEDMVRGVHEHLMFGEGTVDFPPVLAALAEVSYSGGLHVELGRHGASAVEAVSGSAAFLRPLLERAFCVTGRGERA
jgi:sugar phosphate isomerase/epimerase